MLPILRKRNSYYTKIILYLGIVLVLPLCTIVVLNVQSQSVIKKQILLSNQNTLDQTFLLIDTVVTEMRDTTIEVSQRTELSQYIRAWQEGKTEIAYERYELYKLLSVYVLEKYEDLFVYFPQDGYIVSGVNGMLAADHYYEVFFGKEEDCEQDFWDNLNCGSGSPMLDVINAQGQAPKLCVSMRNKLESGLGYCVVTVVMDSAYLQELLYDSYAGRGGTILLFDGKQELMLAGNNKEIPYNLKGYSGSSAPYETCFENKDYMMQVYPSGQLKGFYAYAVPSEYFWDQLFSMRIFSVISILACIALGSVLVIVSAGKAYAPLGNVVKKVNENFPYAGYDENITEFEFLEGIFQSQNAEKQKLYLEVRDNQTNMRERFVLRLLEGYAYEEEKSEDIFQKNGMALCSDRFVVGVLMPETEYENPDGVISFAIVNVFEEIFRNRDEGYVIRLHGGRYVLLLNPGVDTSEERIAEMLEEGKQFLEYHFQLRMSIGCSGICEGMYELQQAYHQALVALDYRYILGKERVIFWWEISERRFTYLDSEHALLPAMLEDYLNQAEHQRTVTGFVSEIFAQYGISEKVSLETVECFKFDMINAVNRVALKTGIAAEERRQFIRKLLEQETLMELEEELAQLLMGFRQRRLERRNNVTGEKAKQFIEENYRDSQLSVSILCEELGVSASYLSRLYKEIYGTTVAQEITRIRLKKAKELLRDTDKSIGEIAEETGFSNGSVFIKVFKKWEGITPGRYRELL